MSMSNDGGKTLNMADMLENAAQRMPSSGLPANGAAGMPHIQQQQLEYAVQQQQELVETIRNLKIEVLSCLCAAGLAGGSAGGIGADQVDLESCAEYGVALAKCVLDSIDIERAEKEEPAPEKDTPESC